MSARTEESREGTGSSGLESEEVVSPLTWVLGIELGFSERA